MHERLPSVSGANSQLRLRNGWVPINITHVVEFSVVYCKIVACNTYTKPCVCVRERESTSFHAPILPTPLLLRFMFAQQQSHIVNWLRDQTVGSLFLLVTSDHWKREHRIHLDFLELKFTF